jgi:hypothetical protein
MIESYFHVTHDGYYGTFPLISLKIIEMKEFQALILCRNFGISSLKLSDSSIFVADFDILLKRENSNVFFERNDQQETRFDVQGLKLMKSRTNYRHMLID